MSGLSWLDFRTTFYILAAQNCEFDLILYPIRNAYEVNILNSISPVRNQYANLVFDAINDKANYAVNRILSPTQPLIMRYNFPMFSAWIASKYKEFVQARDILNNLSALQTKKGNTRYVMESNLFIADFEKQMLQLIDRYGVSTSYMNLTSSFVKGYDILSCFTPLPKIPNIEVSIKKPTGFKKLYKYSGFGATYKSIIEDLTSIWGLNKYHSILSSKVKLTDGR